MDTTSDGRPALASAAERSAELVASVERMDIRLRGSEWSIADAASHLVFGLRTFTESARGDHRAWRRLEDRLGKTSSTAERVALINRLMIRAEPARSPAQAAEAITDAARAFLLAIADLHPEHSIPTPWYGENESLTVSQATSLLLGEQVFHSYDIARALLSRWPIATADALLILEGSRAMMPKLADPVAVGELSATYRFHLGGAQDFVVRCSGGALSVEAPGAQRVDCHVAADPVAFLLLGYGRISQRQALARAKMIAWGRKPWLALRFAGLVTHP